MSTSRTLAAIAARKNEQVTPIPKATKATTKTPATKATPAAKATKATPAKAAAKAAAAEAVKEQVADRLKLQAAAKAEAAALAVWKKAGSKGKRPSTENLDKLNNEYDARLKGEAIPRIAKPKGERAPRTGVQATGDVQFYRNGKPLVESNNRLSRLAWRSTFGMSKNSPDRITTEALVEYLAKNHKITDPYSPSWEVTLPNGQVIACRPNANAAKTEAPAAKSEAPKAKATKAAPAKATTKAARKAA